MSSLADIVGADKIPSVSRFRHRTRLHHPRLQCYPGKAAEITRLRKRVALLDGLLGECLRHHYYDDAQVPPSWLVEARSAVTSTAGRMVD